MSAEKPDCVVIRCDGGCEFLLGEFDGDYTVHFASEAEAIEQADHWGWRKIGDEWFCGTCPISEKAADLLEAAGVEA